MKPTNEILFLWSMITYATEAHKNHTRKLCDPKLGNKHTELQHQLYEFAKENRKEWPTGLTPENVIKEQYKSLGNPTEEDLSPPHGGAYINHPLRIVNYLTILGAPSRLYGPAILHDVIEDTECTEEMIREEFGDYVADTVMELTDDKSKPKATRKKLQVEKASKMSQDAQLIKLADLLDNCTDLLGKGHTYPWDKERVDKYAEWADKIAEEIITTIDDKKRAAWYTRTEEDPERYDAAPKVRVTKMEAFIIEAHYNLQTLTNNYAVDNMTIARGFGGKLTLHSGKQEEGFPKGNEAEFGTSME